MVDGLHHSYFVFVLRQHLETVFEHLDHIDIAWIFELASVDCFEEFLEHNRDDLSHKMVGVVARRTFLGRQLVLDLFVFASSVVFEVGYADGTLL